jgi:hypothetical protein
MRIVNARAATVFIVAVVLGILPRHATAWSYKEHILFTRLAISRLLDDPTTPESMKTWLRQAAGELPDLAGNEHFFKKTRVGRIPVGFTDMAYWVCVPDVRSLDRSGPNVAPFKVRERMLHFIDLELLFNDERKREYKHDLSNKPTVQDIPREMSDPRLIQAGMLPFRIEQCYGELVGAIRADTLHAAAADLQENKTATFWAGFLAHYLADNTQPQHATLDYKAQSYFADRSRAPDVHAEMEYRMCDDEKKDFPSLRDEYWPLFLKYVAELEDPVRQTKDVWLASVQTSLRSYDALPLIGLAAMHAGKQAGTPDHPQGAAAPAAEFDTEAFFRFRGQHMGREMSVLEMKAIQTAWAVRRIEHTLRQAWDEAKGG